MNKERPIIDVRTEAEFKEGNVEGSINIPLNEVPDRIEEFEAMDNPILCCASGNRSGQAAEYLKAQGLECENGGGWLEVNNSLSKNQ